MENAGRPAGEVQWELLEDTCTTEQFYCALSRGCAPKVEGCSASSFRGIKLDSPEYDVKLAYTVQEVRFLWVLFDAPVVGNECSIGHEE